MEKLILKALLREEKGKEACKHIRKIGQVPCVVYRGGKPATSIQVDMKDLWHTLHTEAGENAVITLDISGGEKNSKKTVIVQETQTDPMNDKFLHVDFHEISLTEKIKVSVPLVLKGEAKGVAEEGGVLSQIVWEVEVECLPAAIPEHVDVHVDELGIGDAIHISDVTPPAGVTFLDDPESMLVSVHAPKAEEEEVTEEGAEGAEEPEVIKRGKEEEEGEKDSSGE
jgi:large subunit ribosomal protein L25